MYHHHHQLLNRMHGTTCWLYHTTVANVPQTWWCPAKKLNNKPPWKYMKIIKTVNIGLCLAEKAKHHTAHKVLPLPHCKFYDYTTALTLRTHTHLVAFDINQTVSHWPVPNFSLSTVLGRDAWRMLREQAGPLIHLAVLGSRPDQPVCWLHEKTYVFW